MSGDQTVFQKTRFLGKILKNFIKNLTILSETVTTIFYGHNQNSNRVSLSHFQFTILCIYLQIYIYSSMHQLF